MRNEGDARPQVHTFSRRVFIPLLGLGLVGCAAPTMDIPSPTVLPTRTPSSTTSADTRASQAPKTLSPDQLNEEKAREKIISKWVSIMSSPQKSRSNYEQFRMDLLNLDVWRSYLDSLIKTSAQPLNPPSEPLKMTWTRTAETAVRYAANFSTVQGYSGIKELGVMNIKNIRVSSGTYPRSDIQRENDKDQGITWRGAGTIRFWRQSGVALLTTSTAPDEATIQAWLKKPETVQQRFTDWSEEEIGLQLDVKNGEWEIPKIRLPDQGRSVLQDYELPSTGLLFDRTWSCGEPSSNRPCQNIFVQLK